MVQISSQLLTFEDYQHYDDGSNIRHELRDGKLLPMTPPLRQHSDIACGLFVILYQEIQRFNLDWIVRQGDVGIRTGLRRSRIPDLTVLERSVWENVPSQTAFILEEDPPLLVIEVVSESSVRDDYRYKRTEYAAVRIPEYWIVDPLQGKVSILSWVDGLYEEQIFVGDESIQSPLFSQLSITKGSPFLTGATDHKGMSVEQILAR